MTWDSKDKRQDLKSCYLLLTGEPSQPCQTSFLGPRVVIPHIERGICWKEDLQRMDGILPIIFNKLVTTTVYQQGTRPALKCSHGNHPLFPEEHTKPLFP